MKDYNISLVFKSKQNSKSLVLLRVNSRLVKGGRFQISTGVNAPTHKEIKYTKEITKTITAFEDSFDSFPKNVIRDPGVLRSKINEILFPFADQAKPQKKQLTVAEFVHDQIEKYTVSKKVTSGTIKNWKSLYNNIVWFDKNVTFENVSLTWIENFQHWMKTPHRIYGTRTYNLGKRIKSNGISHDTSMKYIKALKRMLRQAEKSDLNFNVNQGYLKLDVEKRSKDTKYSGVYLSIEEQRQLSNLVLAESKALVRDWILIACSTGQRYSDWDKLRPENVLNTKEGNVIELIQQKTKTKVSIPVGKTVQAIWDKYPKGMKLLSDNAIRTTIKLLCKTIGLDEVIESKPKYKHIGTHIGRYSFVSNSIDQGIPDKTIMAITGHYNKTVFLKYLKLSQKDLALEANKFPMFNQAL
ncbi:MAG: site-specific integrase [Cyclobacteriaceae bacterium]